MAEEWYCKIGDQEIGPFSASQLRALASSGRLVGDDPVRLGHAGTWVLARQVKGLLSAAGSPPAGPGFVPPAEHAPPPIPPSGERSRRILRAQAEPEVPAPAAPASSAGEYSVVVPKVPAERGSSHSPPPPPQRVAASEDPFAFLQEVYAAPPRSVADELKPVSSSKIRRHQKTLLMVLLGLLGVLTVLLIVLGVVTSLRDTSRIAKLGEAAREAAQRAENSDEAEEGTGGPRKTPPSAKRSDPVNALDPAKDEWKVGDVRVKVTAAEITQPRVYKFSKPAGRVQEDCLLIRLSLHNGSSTKKIDYLKWDNPTARPKLVDNLNNDYQLQTFSTGYLVEGQPASRSIYPEKTVEDVLVFKPPVARAETLLLQLPGEIFREKGAGYFEIPIKMLVKLPPPKEPAAEGKPAAAAGGAKDKTGPPASAGETLPPGVPELDLKRQEDDLLKPPAAKPEKGDDLRGTSPGPNGAAQPDSPPKSSGAGGAAKR